MGEKKRLPSILLFAFILTFFQGYGQRPVNFVSRDLFVCGQYHVKQYRTPSLTTSNKGSLIAVCEAQIDKVADAPNNIDLVGRRSFDNGKTWVDQKILFDYLGDEAACDASFVVGKQMGALWMAYDHPVPELQGNYWRIIRIHLSKSDNDGVTWSAPIELNYLTNGKNFGLQNAWKRGLFADRVILFSTHTSKNGNRRDQQTVLVYCKDLGKTWSLSNRVGKADPEPQVVNFSSGKVMANMRTPHRNGYRQVAVTRNLGITWSEVSANSSLVEPGCLASLINYDFKNKSLLIFSNPSDKQGRKNLVVLLSDNEGKGMAKNCLFMKELQLIPA